MTEPMYLISESELNKLFRFKELKNGNVKIWTGSTGTADDTFKNVGLVKQIRARGPVQQAPAIARHLGTIRASSDAMKYLSDEEIITRCLSLMAAMFSAQNERRKEPAVFFDE